MMEELFVRVVETISGQRGKPANLTFCWRAIVIHSQPIYDTGAVEMCVSCR
jgi:low affinity Fe/Cu permease